MNADDASLGLNPDFSAMPEGNALAFLLPQILDHAPAVMLVAVGPDLRIVYANRSAEHAARSAVGALAGCRAGNAFAFIDPILASRAPQADGRLVEARAVADRQREETRWWDVSYVMLDNPALAAPAVLITAVDVTYHEIARAQRAQAALQEGEERLRAVLLQIPAAIFIVEAPDGLVTFQSELLEQVLGTNDLDMAKAKATLRGWAVHKDGRPYDLREYPSRRALFCGETVRAEPMEYWRSDGRIINLEMHAGPVRDRNGEIIAAVAVALDVTERLRAEARNVFLLQLQDSLRKLDHPRDVLNAAAAHLGRHLGAARIGFTELQPDGETVLVTNLYADALPPVNGFFPMASFGAGPSTCAGQGQTVVHEDAQSDETGARALALELGTRGHVSVPLIREGSYTGALYVTHLKPYQWTQEEIALIEDVAARIWDAAERLRAESRLRESEERLRLALESSGLSYWEYNAVTGKTIRSDRHDEVFGYPERLSEWSFARFKSHILEADLAEVEAGFHAALKQGKDWDVECRMLRADGSHGWLEIRARPHRGADGRISRLLGTVRDISARKHAEQALADLNATLEQQVQDRTVELMAAEASLRHSQKMEAVGQLTGGLAHDFNNLLAGISGSLELLQKRLAQRRFGELNGYLNTAQGAAKRAAALTHRLLAFSRRQTLDPKPTDVNRLVAGIDALICQTMAPGIDVIIAGAPGLWGVLVDPNQLENAVLNLCINARDAMPDGGTLTIETSNETLAAGEARKLELEAGAYVCVTVSDTGSGMMPEVIARAFDPFFTTKPIGEGTGLGLSMVYGFARQSGGQARILSEPGKGTSVSIYLPSFLNEQKFFQEKADAEIAQPGGGETILVVDDDATVRMLAREVLGELDYRILEAADGNSALDILMSARRVDLLITDVGLPGGLNGRQLADAALFYRPDLKVLFITGYAENAVCGDGQLKPGMHLMIKPFSLEILGGRVKEIISGV